MYPVAFFYLGYHLQHVGQGHDEVEGRPDFDPYDVLEHDAGGCQGEDTYAAGPDKTDKYIRGKYGPGRVYQRTPSASGNRLLRGR